VALSPTPTTSTWIESVMRASATLMELWEVSKCDPEEKLAEARSSPESQAANEEKYKNCCA
jgi:hypothetical protein